VLEAVFILLEFPSPSRRIFIGSHSLPPLWFAVPVLQSAPIHSPLSDPQLSPSFYTVDQKTALLKRTGHRPVKIRTWDIPFSFREIEDLKELLAILVNLKRRGLTGGVVAMSFS
jgi:hypothetical protein